MCDWDASNFIGIPHRIRGRQKNKYFKNRDNLYPDGVFNIFNNRVNILRSHQKRTAVGSGESGQLGNRGWFVNRRIDSNQRFFLATFTDSFKNSDDVETEIAYVGGEDEHSGHNNFGNFGDDFGNALFVTDLCWHGHPAGSIGNEYGFGRFVFYLLQLFICFAADSGFVGDVQGTGSNRDARMGTQGREVDETDAGGGAGGDGRVADI